MSDAANHQQLAFPFMPTADGEDHRSVEEPDLTASELAMVTNGGIELVISENGESAELGEEVAEPLAEEERLERLIAERQESDYHQRRIKHLEQALLQCQVYIDELKAALNDQDLLEDQLAKTEEYTHIQQQAIATLKAQLGQTQSSQVELDDLHQQKSTLQQQLKDQEAELEALQLQQQQTHTELENLRDQYSRLCHQLQYSQESTVQETQQRIIAQQTSERLRNQLQIAASQQQALEAKLAQVESNLQEDQHIIAALQKSTQSDSQKNQAIQGLSATLLNSQKKIAHLEAELSQQTIIQAQLQQASHELEAQANQDRERATALESQIAEMQEQILHQAQQASEYETAVQHWKDRAKRSTQILSQFQPLLNLWMNHPDTFSRDEESVGKLSQLLADLNQMLTPPPTDSINTLESFRSLRFELSGLRQQLRNRPE